MRPELVEGDHGVFDVAVNGVIVFSKQAAGDFIAISDMVERIKHHQ